jgi:hypothetical protein
VGAGAAQGSRPSASLWSGASVKPRAQGLLAICEVKERALVPWKRLERLNSQDCGSERHVGSVPFRAHSGMFVEDGASKLVVGDVAGGVFGEEFLG